MLNKAKQMRNYVELGRLATSSNNQNCMSYLGRTCRHDHKCLTGMVSAINVIQGGNVLHGICYSDKDMYVGCSSATGSVY